MADNIKCIKMMIRKDGRRGRSWKQGKRARGNYRNEVKMLNKKIKKKRRRRKPVKEKRQNREKLKNKKRG